ncbi:MAG: hypothetical protein JOY59_03050 [Candidatus Eremiobacteraeota bacterium]|nr:hypothetical protein [Candidatus Eremiobacteraeota bacterium]
MSAAARGGKLHHDAHRPATASGASHHQPVSGKARCSAKAHVTATAAGTAVVEVMVRRLVTAVVLAAMVGIVSGCGRQVTGLGQASSQNGTPPGYSTMYFFTGAPINPQKYSYLIVFNTNGSLGQANAGEPYSLGNNSNFSKWSDVIVIGGTNAGFLGVTAGQVGSPSIFQIYTNTQSPAGYSAFNLTSAFPPSYVVFRPTVPTSTQNGFTLQFNRCILDQPNPSATPRPTPNPNTDCGGSGPSSYSFINSVWFINLFTVDATGTVQDSIGPNGANDTTAQFFVDTTQLLNGNGSASYQPTKAAPLQDQSAQITGIQFFNTP